jgi:hypothetical protein
LNFKNLNINIVIKLLGAITIQKASKKWCD